MSYGILGCPEQRHEYYLNLPKKFYGKTMWKSILLCCLSACYICIAAILNLSSKILIEYNESHFADNLQTKIWWIQEFVLVLSGLSRARQSEPRRWIRRYGCREGGESECKNACDKGSFYITESFPVFQIHVNHPFFFVVHAQYSIKYYRNVTKFAVT